ncbi:esterase/lipase family protein [Vibrio algarum]|uniref:Alpha/beta hydrolase n=1 Tax=Vibrio algarum TaxID=3020714 RepID=A0ABT4YX96_9VIBR|nr:alpha/beta hydrolase [Vibrio sp. KJ40-1]MDB1126219.1 alpha/beta hydrolase [Vibrio sp. KJ40-1]
MRKMEQILNVISWGLVLILGSGCSYIGLTQNVALLNHSSSISGVVGSEESDTPIVVTLNKVTGENVKLEEFVTTFPNDLFRFTVEEGSYYLFAFEDPNKNFTLDENERIAFYGSPSLLRLEPHENVGNLNLQLLSTDSAKRVLPRIYSPESPYKPVSHQSNSLGKVVIPSYFQPTVGRLGMWEPVKFHEMGNSGIFFLEEYEPHKIPVLFVHGMSGSGYDWLNLANELDRNIYQPWIVQYPSGIDLELSSQMLHQSVTELAIRFDVSEIKVVAHSMGGLVSKSFINHVFSSKPQQPNISSFITISTPWAGHDAAQIGIKYMPVAVPSWFNMAPNSKFLRNLKAVPLREHLSFHLFFSYRDNPSLISSKNTDGVVSIESQLMTEAQDDAISVYGLNESHTSILKSPIMAKKLNEALKMSH